MNKEKYLFRIIPLLKVEGLSLSMDNIADEIGVSRKTLYNNFQSKDELMAQCSARLLKEFSKMTQCLTDADVPVAEGFRDGILGVRNFFREASHVFTRDLMEMYPGLASDSHNSGTSLFEQRLRENIERGQADGTYRSDVDPALFSKFIAFSVFSFFQKEIMTGKSCPADEYFDKVIDFNLHAILNNK